MPRADAPPPLTAWVAIPPGEDLGPDCCQDIRATEGDAWFIARDVASGSGPLVGADEAKARGWRVVRVTVAAKSGGDV